MGNSVGHYPENAYNLKFHPDVTPVPESEPTFDPNYGFPNGRKKRSEFLCNDCYSQKFTSKMQLIIALKTLCKWKQRDGYITR